MTAASSVAKSRPTVSAMMPPAASVKPSPRLASLEIMAAAEVTPAKMMSRPVTGPFVSVAASQNRIRDPRDRSDGDRDVRPSVPRTHRASAHGPAHSWSPPRGPRSVSRCIPRIRVPRDPWSPRSRGPRSPRSATSSPRPKSRRPPRCARGPSSAGPRSANSSRGRRLSSRQSASLSVATSFVPVVVAQIASGFTSLVIQLIRAHFVRRRTPFRPCRELRQTGCRDSAQKKQHIVPHD